MKNKSWIGVLVLACFLNSCQTKPAENKTETIALSEVPDVEGSATDIANTWCELMRLEFRAKNGDDAAQITATEKVVTDYQKKVEEKFENDPAMIERIIAEMVSCDAATEGRKK